ncbi:class V chitinase-like [Juglans microcarpa x Juglans regia]|uniref:class V chitinase-like n=1 Tax=Juglans microcarpa x Juglans regia TaxID=2249226 RepID=UPI001B7F55E9|nr:class V chitinase-like [Juglans microcarpa x Juglans regia]
MAIYRRDLSSQSCTPNLTYSSSNQRVLGTIALSQSSISSNMASTGVVKAGYWHCDSAFLVSDIKSSLFTHLFAAFADVNPITYQVTFPTLHKLQFETFTSTVQIKNPDVKTLLSIGGGAPGVSSTLASMASKQENREIFIVSSITLARENNFHGLCLSWQYPSTAVEMTNLQSLLKEWRAAVEIEARTTTKARLLLTAEVFHSPDICSAGARYPCKAISNYLDWIRVLAYNFYTAASSPNETAPPAPLRNKRDVSLCVEASIDTWIRAGVHAKKLVLGLPFFGWAWILIDPSQHGLFAPAHGLAVVQHKSVDGSVPFAGVKKF